VDVLECEKCGGRLRIIASITDGGVIRKILSAVGLATDSPAPYPAKGFEEAFGDGVVA
jgi:hypothetical protein